MKLRTSMANDSNPEDQWDGTDIEPTYPCRYSVEAPKTETSDLPDDYIRSYREGDRYA